MLYQPHDYQKYATRFIVEHPVAAVLLQMGLGKSVITLTAIAELALERFEVCRQPLDFLSVQSVYVTTQNERRDKHDATNEPRGAQRNGSSDFGAAWQPGGLPTYTDLRLQDRRPDG